MEQLKLSGTIVLTPDANTDATFVLAASMSLAANEAVVGRTTVVTELTADPAFSVPFNGLTKANVVVISTTAEVVLAFTSADGSAQTVPVGSPGLIHFAGSGGITALTITRRTGKDTSVQVMLVQTS